MRNKKRTLPPSPEQKARIYQLQTGYRPPVKEQPKPDLTEAYRMMEVCRDALNALNSLLWLKHKEGVISLKR